MSEIYPLPAGLPTMKAMSIGLNLQKFLQSIDRLLVFFFHNDNSYVSQYINSQIQTNLYRSQSQVRQKQIVLGSQQIVVKMTDLLINYNQQMHNLRSTLGKQTEQSEGSISRTMPSKIVNKSKNGSIWAIDPDQDQNQPQGQEQPKQKNKLKLYIEISLNSAFKNDPIFTEMCFFEVMQQIQAKNPTASELECLLAIEQKIHESQKTAEKQLEEFLSAFNECLIKRIKKLRKKQKKNELEQYNKIVKNTFKKKGPVQYIDDDAPEKKNRLQVKEQQLARMYGSKDLKDGSSRKNGSGSSSEGKLGKLLSNTKLKDEKKESSSLQKIGQQQSISFSAIVSQSVTVRQRHRNEVFKPKKDKEQINPKRGKDEGDLDNQQAFIFFRPKATRKR